MINKLLYFNLYAHLSFKVVERPSLKKTYSQWQDTGCVDLSCVRYTYTPENPISFFLLNDGTY